ncbi:MAG: NirD/YgiW/YdeI family stress tolerance protein [Zoogloeaceae bacterium]|jgi:uncharacterized protein (TIGR00156 family)|nr:NirD/YgiW/YdeI family stress tolerance protein [Zoogloeaceae bacterium]
MMKKFFSLSALFFFLSTAAFAQGGFVGPSATSEAKTIVEAKDLPDDARVTLQGNIVRALGDEKYLFRDKTGEIVVEIDDEIWRGQTVEPRDAVEIRGEIDRDWGFSVEIEADTLKKL